jgi:hypothetical protein
MKSKNNIKVLTVAVLCLFFSLAVEVQAGSITGRVFDSSNNPVPNLRVDVCAAVKKDNGDIDWKTSSLVKTESDGSYTWPNLTPGDYKVRYSANTVPELGLATEWYNDQTDFDTATPITVGAESVPLNDVILSGGGSISGTVTNGTSGIKDIVVYVYDSSGTWTSTVTKDGGTYIVKNLQTGDYTLKFSGGDTGYITEWYDDTDEANAVSVHVDAPNEKENINAVLDVGLSISGKVTVLETGAPLVGAWISVCDSSTTASCPDSSNPVWKNYAITGTDGSYTVGGLSSSGSYKVQFFERMINNAGAGINKWYSGKTDASTADSVSVGQTDVDAVFNGASISGTVTESGGSGIAGVTVKAYDSNGNLAATSELTESSGAYTIVGLQRGSYTLYFQADGTGYSSEWYNNQTEENSADAVDITSLGDALTEKDAELDLGVSISGTVTILKDANSEPVPVSGGMVQVYDSTDSTLLKGTATTGTDGIYEVTGLSAGGSFKVRFFENTAENGSGYGISEWYNDQHNFDQANLVKAGDATVDAVLEPSSLLPVYKLLLLKPRPQSENP